MTSGDALPDLVLLDLDLPGAGGREVLESIRSTPGLACLSVFIQRFWVELVSAPMR